MIIVIIIKTKNADDEENNDNDDQARGNLFQTKNITNYFGPPNRTHRKR